MSQKQFAYIMSGDKPAMIIVDWRCSKCHGADDLLALNHSEVPFDEVEISEGCGCGCYAREVSVFLTCQHCKKDRTLSLQKSLFKQLGQDFQPPIITRPSSDGRVFLCLHLNRPISVYNISVSANCASPVWGLGRVWSLYGIPVSLVF